MPLRVRGHSPGPTEQYGTKGLRQSGFGAIQARINGNIGFRGNTPGKSNCRGTPGLFAAFPHLPFAEPSGSLHAQGEIVLAAFEGHRQSW